MKEETRKEYLAMRWRGDADCASCGHDVELHVWGVHDGPCHECECLMYEETL